MGEFSILDIEDSGKDTIALSPYYIDFNIDRIVKEISEYWKEDVTKYFRYFPGKEKGVTYRRAVYGDICREGVSDKLMQFRQLMMERATIIKNKELTRSAIQKKVMTITEVIHYAKAVECLVEMKDAYEFSSEGMCTFLDMVKEYHDSDSFKELKNKAEQIRADFDAIAIKLVYEDRYLTISFEETQGDYDGFLKSFYGENVATDLFKGMKNPMGEAVEITAIEEAVLELLYDKNKDLFRAVDRFYKDNPLYAKSFLTLFYQEISFYLAFYNFTKEMKAFGFWFALPEKSEDREMRATDLYDLALACQNYKNGKPVVPNDVYMKNDENFFVLTGPNQGGKTTFARALGQLIFFWKIGLPVPAKQATLPFFNRILTHFSVEESVETGKGKLAEELSRLAPMMDAKEETNDFVVINELFTTAANYDAVIMGKRVLEHFINHKCSGIYVTHLQELAEEGNGIVSMRALMNEQNIQSFKVIRSTEPAKESSIILVEKHQLHYEQVRERLGGE